MPNVSGARNVYGSRTLVGNWTEDAAGAALAAHLARSTPRTGASEASAAYRAPPPDAAPAEPAPPPLDTLRVGLLMPHGPNIVKPPPGEPDTRHTSLAAAAARGVPDGGAGKDAAPGEGRRTDLIRARELRLAAGVDARDPPSVLRAFAAAALPTTTARPYAVAGRGVPTPSPRGAVDMYTPTGELELRAAATAAAVAPPRAAGEPWHGSSRAFTGRGGGIAGLRE